MNNYIDLTGKQFGSWKVVGRVYSTGTGARYACVCDRCGCTKAYDSNVLTRERYGKCKCIVNRKLLYVLSEYNGRYSIECFISTKNDKNNSLLTSLKLNVIGVFTEEDYKKLCKINRLNQKDYDDLINRFSLELIDYFEGKWLYEI